MEALLLKALELNQGFLWTSCNFNTQGVMDNFVWQERSNIVQGLLQGFLSYGFLIRPLLGATLTLV